MADTPPADDAAVNGAYAPPVLPEDAPTTAVGPAPSLTAVPVRVLSRDVADVENTVTWLEFLSFFTPAEQLAVVESTNPYVRLFAFMASGLGGDLNIADPRVAQGLDALVGAGIIDVERRDRVLQKLPPA